VVFTSWFDAVAYCNWLSKQERLPQSEWCYEPNPQGEFAQGMKLAQNYLRRSGYRLPTEAEWEYAARAGAVTSRYFGESEELLPRYAWYNKYALDRTWPVGSLKPNDLALFDVLGNVWTWCQDRFKDYRQGEVEKPDEDTEDGLTINFQQFRVIRGGAFDTHASLVRSADRLWRVPSLRFHNLGLRPARTFAP
jgi:formylglycine-generating enzyme required for sulfatase activity